MQCVSDANSRMMCAVHCFAFSLSTPSNLSPVSRDMKAVPGAPLRPSYRRSLSHVPRPVTRVKLSKRFPCKTRTGMSCAVDTAWHKRGFDSLTGV